MVVVYLELKLLNVSGLTVEVASIPGLQVLRLTGWPSPDPTLLLLQADDTCLPGKIELILIISLYASSILIRPCLCWSINSSWKI